MLTLLITKYDILPKSTKEKIVDYAAKKFIVIVDESKVVDSLGDFPVPVEVLPDASRMLPGKSCIR